MRRLLLVLLGLFIATPALAQLPSQQCVAPTVASGTGDAIAIPLLPCTETTTLLILTFIAANTTSTPTISVNGQTPHVIVNFDGSTLPGGFLQPNQRRLLTYNGANWIILSGAGGGGGGCVTATPSSIGCVQPDNTTITISGGVITAVASGVAKPYDIVGQSDASSALSASQVITRYTAARPISFAANFGVQAGGTSGATAAVAATSSTVITVNKAPASSPNTFTQIGTVTFAGGQVVASFATTGGTSKSLAPGDVLTYVGPASPDATLAGVSITIVGML